MANEPGIESFEHSNKGVAVSGELLSGRQDNLDVKSGYITFTTPPRLPVGFHLEAVRDDTEGDIFEGIGGHLYYRYKDWGLVGLAGVKSNIDLAETDAFPAIENLEVRTYGIELEINIHSFVFALQNGRIDSQDLEFEKDYYDQVQLHWFASDDWHTVISRHQFANKTTNLLETDYSYVRDKFYYGMYVGGTWDAFENSYIGLEFGPAARSRGNWVLFLEFDKGEHGYDAVFAGLSIGFGPAESAPVQSLFDRNNGGYSFISTQSGVSIIDEGL